MEKYILTITDGSKKELLLRFLKEINFVHIEKKAEDVLPRSESNFKELFGIWKNRDISLNEIRNKAWNRN